MIFSVLHAPSKVKLHKSINCKDFFISSLVIMLFKSSLSLLQKSISPTLRKQVQGRSLNVVARPSELVGNTPLICLNGILQKHGVDGEFLFFVRRKMIDDSRLWCPIEKVLTNCDGEKNHPIIITSPAQHNTTSLEWNKISW